MTNLWYHKRIAACVVLFLAVALGACSLNPGVVPLKVDALAVQAETAVPPTQTPIAPTQTPFAAVATAGPTVSSAVGAPPPSAQTILETALEKFRTVDTWHIEAGLQITAEVSSLTFVVPALYVADYYAPDRLEGTVTTQILGVTRKRDVTLLANTIEVADPGAPGAVAKVTPTTWLSMLDFIGLKPANLKTLELVGQESLDGTPVYHVRGKVNTEELDISQQNVEMKLRGELVFDAWMNVADGFMRLATAKGGLTGTGSQTGSFHIEGTASFFDYGQPVTTEPSQYTVAAGGGASCVAADKGFISYRDQAEAMNFCYPSNWIVDPLIDPCAYYSVSPTGVQPTAPVPDSLVVVYPNSTVTRFIGSPAGAGEVFSRSGLCFFKYAFDHARAQGLGTLSQGFLGSDTLVAMLSGIQYGDAKGAALSGMTDEAKYLATVEAIVYSIAPGKAAGQ